MITTIAELRPNIEATIYRPWKANNCRQTWKGNQNSKNNQNSDKFPVLVFLCVFSFFSLLFLFFSFFPFHSISNARQPASQNSITDTEASLSLFLSLPSSFSFSSGLSSRQCPVMKVSSHSGYSGTVVATAMVTMGAMEVLKLRNKIFIFVQEKRIKGLLWSEEYWMKPPFSPLFSLTDP